MLADCLLEKTQQAGMTFKSTPLVPPTQNSKNAYRHNKKWGVVVNYEVEIG